MSTARQGMSLKRALEYDEEDGDFMFRRPDRTKAQKRFRSYGEPLANKHAHDSAPTVILSGFTWSVDVDIWIARALEPNDALFMEVSLDLSEHEKLDIKHKYDIQDDFVKVVCGSWESRERLITDLDHAIFTWTTPSLEVRKLDVEEFAGRAGVNDNLRDPIRPVICSASPIAPEQQIREVQSKVWIKLSEAITSARANLLGDDLDTFEALIAKPVPGVDPMDRVRRWIRGDVTDSHLPRLAVDAQRVEFEDLWDVSANKENVELKKADKGYREDVTMDDEMAERGFEFGQTDLTPWW